METNSALPMPRQAIHVTAIEQAQRRAKSTAVTIIPVVTLQFWAHYAFFFA